MIKIHKNPTEYTPIGQPSWFKQKADWEIFLPSEKRLMGQFHYKMPRTIKLVDFFGADRIIYKEGKFVFQSRNGGESTLSTEEVEEILSEKSGDFRSRYFCDLID